MVTIDDSGNASFSVEVSGTAALDNYITATATSHTTGNTSEFSAPVRLTEGISSAADLALTKTASPTPVREAEKLTYTLTVNNNSPIEATGVRAVDTLPTNANFVTTTVSQGTRVHNNGTITFNLGRIDSNDTATITIIVRAIAVGVILP
jgi:uncharacterized repeat protein (TIGR01451 family)